MFIKFLKFLTSNILYIIWFIIYFTIAWFLLGANGRSFFITAVLYTISISFALSPAGEWVIRKKENCRVPVTEQETEYLLPIFYEVYQQAKTENPKLNGNIKIYISDSVTVNAFAVGRQTVAVTRGALVTFTPEQLRGVIAHELGHITYGHTKALLLSTVGNVFFSISIIVLRAIATFIQSFIGALSEQNPVLIILHIASFLMRIMLEIGLFIFVYLSQILLALNSRTNEIQADNFAYSIGLGYELISALYLLQKISMHQKLTLSEQLMASHPHTADRIHRLEIKVNQEYECNPACIEN